MADVLTIWMYDIEIATVEQRQRARLRLSYTEEALQTFALGTPLLSLRLPLAAAPYSHGVVAAFLDGLLPEGEQRLIIAADLEVRANDTFALIEALGRDSAGALLILPAGQKPAPVSTTLTAMPLDEDELGDLVSNLRNAPLGIGDQVRLSLAGVQEKLVLTRMPDGSWGRPVDGTPSTHILKPEIANYPATVENEAFCMRIAKHLGLPVAHVDTTVVKGRKLLVVERYDRVIHSDGTVRRIHQEDFCQALGLPPTKKYEEDGGPSLRRVAQTLNSAAAAPSLEMLLRGVVLNVLVGNGDAHGKNYSLMHDERGRVSLAPLYDVLSTLAYGQNRLAMFIDGVQRTDRVTTDRIVVEATTWGLSSQRAVDVVADMLERMPLAVDAAAAETAGVPPEVLKVLDSQSARLRSTLTTAG